MGKFESLRKTMKLTIAALLATIGMASEGHGHVYRKPAHHSRAGYAQRAAAYRHNYGRGRGEGRQVGQTTRVLPDPGVRGIEGQRIYRRDPAHGHYDNDRRRDNFLVANSHRQRYLNGLRHGQGKYTNPGGSLRGLGRKTGYGDGERVYSNRRPVPVRRGRGLNYDARRAHRPAYGPDYRGRNGGYRNARPAYGGYGAGYGRRSAPVNRYPKQYGGFSLGSFGIGEGINGYSLGGKTGLSLGNRGGYGGFSVPGFGSDGAFTGLNLNQYNGLGKW